MASAAFGWALFTLVVLHAVSAFDPLADPLSRYAFTDHGNGMLEASLLAFAVGVVAARAALRTSGLATGRMLTVLAWATALGLVTAALFPATFTDDIAPASGALHQYASVLAFAALPAMAFSLLDGARERAERAEEYVVLRRVFVAALGTLGLFALSYVASALPETPALTMLTSVLPVGFTQRLVFAADFCLVASMLLLATRAARLSQPPDQVV